MPETKKLIECKNFGRNYEHFSRLFQSLQYFALLQIMPQFPKQKKTKIFYFFQWTKFFNFFYRNNKNIRYRNFFPFAKVKDLIYPSKKARKRKMLKIFFLHKHFNFIHKKNVPHRNSSYFFLLIFCYPRVFLHFTLLIFYVFSIPVECEVHLGVCEYRQRVYVGSMKEISPPLKKKQHFYLSSGIGNEWTKRKK